MGEQEPSTQLVRQARGFLIKDISVVEAVIGGLPS